ncbi:m7GpppN-mRNA hydrolase NUDT17 [Athene noctua]|uniref:m7GpppN-mRNA hydrolase NUDT17 n=1 Tax=Athene noctua TaxID=126797 RepID=UPI003EB8B756
MAGLRRVLVHVRRGGAERPARAGQSVTGTFCPAHADAAVVSCGLDRGRFLLSDAPFPGSTVALLERPPSCPAKRLGEPPAGGLPPQLRGQGVAAAVATLLQASTGRVLLTRRAAALSTFPSVWVPPGGHVEPDEELLPAGLRELEEETGLRLEPGTFSWRTLGLWESVYPPALSQGLPRHHHVIVYLLLRSAEGHRRLEARLRPSAREVSACAWLEPSVLEAIAQEGPEGVGHVAEAPPATVGGTERSDGPSGTFLRPGRGRVSAGTKFALRRWLGARGAAGPPNSSTQ